MMSTNSPWFRSRNSNKSKMRRMEAKRAKTHNIVQETPPQPYCSEIRPLPPPVEIQPTQTQPTTCTCACGKQ